MPRETLRESSDVTSELGATAESRTFLVFSRKAAIFLADETVLAVLNVLS